MNIADTKDWKTLQDSRWPDVGLSQISNVDKMTENTLNILQLMVKRAKEVKGWQFNINSSYRDGDPKSHGRGEAIDGYFYKDSPGDVQLGDQLLFALQYNWRGVGYYPEWNTPGIHVDNRTGSEWKDRRAIWRREKNGDYVMGYDTKISALFA